MQRPLSCCTLSLLLLGLSVPTVATVLPEHNWRQVSSYGEGTLAIDEDGSLWGWGNNARCAVGDATATTINTPTRIGTDTDWLMAAKGDSHSLAVKTDGTLWAWGENDDGELGLGYASDWGDWVCKPTPVGSERDWAFVSAGWNTSAAVKDTGTLWSWGATEKGRAGIPDDHPGVSGNDWERYAPYPIQIGAFREWQSVSLGNYHGIALATDGTLWSWGHNNWGQTGIALNHPAMRFKYPDSVESAFVETPTQVGSEQSWATISAAEDHNFAVKTDGTLWTWGQSRQGRTAIAPDHPDYGSVLNDAIVQPVQVGTDADWIKAVGGRYVSAGLKASGSLWYWGESRVSYGDKMHAIKSLGGGRTWSDIAAGDDHMHALASDGSLWSLGDNKRASLGIGTGGDVPVYAPQQVGSANDWQQLMTTRWTITAKKHNQEAWVWGGLISERLVADNRRGSTILPVKSDVSDWVQASPGDGRSLRQKADGSLWSWDYDEQGELGSNHLIPGVWAVPDQPGQRTLYGDDRLGIAIAADGSLQSWQYHDPFCEGGCVSEAVVPTPLHSGPWERFAVDQHWRTEMADYTELDLLLIHRTDGSLWHLVLDYTGQSQLSIRTLEKVSDKSGWQQATILSDRRDVPKSLFAIDAEGVLWAKGGNHNGSLGVGSTEPVIDVWTPVVTDDELLHGPWVELHPHMALKSDGTLWAWGCDREGYYWFEGPGEVRDYPTRCETAPTRVRDNGARWQTLVSFGYYDDYRHSPERILGIQQDGTLWSWGDHWGWGGTLLGLGYGYSDHLLQATRGTGVSDSDGDGLADSLDACPQDHPHGLDADGDGCSDSADTLAGLLAAATDVQLAPQIAGSLQAKIDTIQALVETGDLTAADNHLQALVNQVKAQKGKKIDTETAALLTQIAENIAATLAL